MFGLLNVNKPAGSTSRDVVNHIQRIVRPEKAGHAGTLDPLATGVLVVCLGAATRLIEYVQRMPKRYTGTFLLGRRSDTEDIEGTVSELSDVPRPSRKRLEASLAGFVGAIEQRPPAFSALKIQGKRAYDLARQGKHVALPPRRIVIHELKLLSYEYPEFVLDITCGSGTYVRSLGRDIAESLGTAAVMATLARTAIGVFEIDAACDPDDLSADSLGSHLQSPLTALSALPAVVLNAEEARRIGHGLSIANRFQLGADEIVAQDGNNNLLAILTPRDAQSLGPLRNFPVA